MYELGTSDKEEALKAAIIYSHRFLTSYLQSIKFRITPSRISVWWDDETPNPNGLHKGDPWFGSSYNYATMYHCNMCGGTGTDHYTPMLTCWACDGEGIRKRKHGLKVKEGESFQDYTEEWRKTMNGADNQKFKLWMSDIYNRIDREYIAPEYREAWEILRPGLWPERRKKMIDDRRSAEEEEK